VNSWLEYIFSVLETRDWSESLSFFYLGANWHCVFRFVDVWNWRRKPACLLWRLIKSLGRFTLLCMLWSVVARAFPFPFCGLFRMDKWYQTHKELLLDEKGCCDITSFFETCFNLIFFAAKMHQQSVKSSPAARTTPGGPNRRGLTAVTSAAPKTPLSLLKEGKSSNVATPRANLLPAQVKPRTPVVTTLKNLKSTAPVTPNGTKAGGHGSTPRRVPIMGTARGTPKAKTPSLKVSPAKKLTPAAETSIVKKFTPTQPQAVTKLHEQIKLQNDLSFAQDGLIKE